MNFAKRVPFFWGFVLLAAILFSPLLRAQTVLMGTGVAGNTYDEMARQLVERCSAADVGLKQTAGTLQNIDMVLGNKLDAAFGQEDSLFLRKASNPAVERLKTVLALHPEEVHVIAPKNSGLTQKKTLLGIERQGDPIVFGNVEQLAGYVVAAGGGSYDTARLISSNSGAAFTVVKAKDNDDALAMVTSGRAQALLAVAGAPSGWVGNLPAGKFKLLPFKQATIERLVAIYSTAVLTYDNLDSENVRSVSTNAVIFSREFTDPKVVDALARFRRCAQDNLQSLKNTRGTHPKWQDVPAGGKPKWPWYELPTPSSATAATPIRR